MKMNELFNHTFKALHDQLGHKCTMDNGQWITDNPGQRCLVEQMRSNSSMFCQALVNNGYMTMEEMQRAAERYLLGITRDGGVVFWQIDEQHVLRDGKIMFYKPDCHRDHEQHPSWASARLKQQGLLPESFAPQRCLFGLHLLGHTEIFTHTNLTDNNMPNICVVEAEKTAVIMSEVFPEYVWMASGGLTMLTAALLQPLKGREVVLFPDTDTEGKAYRLWRDVAEAASDTMEQPIYVSSLLEERATSEQKAAKIDLIDFLF